MSALKLWSAGGGTQTLAQIAISDGHRVAGLVGLRNKRPPLQVEMQHGAFYIGKGAHDWGRAIENLDYDRLTGTPEMRALFYAGLTEHIKQHGLTSPISIIIGLPLDPVTGDQATVTANVNAIKGWLRGKHEWTADGQQYRVDIADVKATSQPAGALFDYLLDDDGQFIPARRSYLKKDVGVISIGFNTIELLIVRDRAPLQRATSSDTSGARRLLEMLNPGDAYSLAELDSKLRDHRINTRDALPVWESEIVGFIERKWGKARRGLSLVLAVGGGAILLRNTLIKAFNGMAIVPDDPVMSIAHGLYKLSLSQKRVVGDGQAAG